MFGDQVTRDLEVVLKSVRDIGFDSVEVIDEVMTLGARHLRELLDDNGLTCSGLHTDFSSVEDPRRLEACIAFIDAVGAPNLICSGVSDNESIDGYDESAETFNRVGERCLSGNKAFYYHDHEFDFRPLAGGVTGIHRIAAKTDAPLVRLAIDVYWVAMGGEDPAGFIRRYARRSGYYHLKDGKKDSFTELGRGTVDLPSVVRAAQENRFDWAIYEQDICELPVVESARISREYLRTLGL